MTQVPSLIGLFVAPLNRAGIEYMVTGGLAAVVYGHPRLTLDVDLVMRLSARDADALAALWPPGEFYSPPAEVIQEERARHAVSAPRRPRRIRLPHGWRTEASCCPPVASRGIV